MLSIGAAATLACVYEATAPKPGNVHPGARFADVSYADFVVSAVVVGPIFDHVASRGVGRSVLDAVRATRDAVGTNTNLGTLLLIAPLAAVPLGQAVADGVPPVLAALDENDTRHVYEAIRVAGAGGLGRAPEADVHAEPPPSLRLADAMRLAADRDLVARQYINRFDEVLHCSAAWIADGLGRGLPLSDAIVFAGMRLMAIHPDSLIQRKCGLSVAHEASDRARRVVASGEPGGGEYKRSLAEFDAWLRADGHRRNPGTTADLIAAGLFVLFREGRLIRAQW